jgi:hypothetical protein
MSLTSVTDSYLNQLSTAEKNPIKQLNTFTASPQTTSHSPQSDYVTLSAAGMAALNAPDYDGGK